MESLMFFIPIILLISYIVGSIPFGYIVGQLNGIDIRKHGSGNIGATNVLRTLGKKWGYICFSLDFIKGFLPVLLANIVAKKYFLESVDILMAIALVGVFCGHVWTIFLGFRGGKGIATAAGAIFAISPAPTLISFFVWVLVFFVWRFVSLASIAASLSLPPLYFCFAKIAGHPVSKVFLGTFIAISCLSIIKHRTNIARLLKGTELHFGKSEENK